MLAMFFRIIPRFTRIHFPSNGKRVLHSRLQFPFHFCNASTCKHSRILFRDGHGTFTLTYGESARSSQRSAIRITSNILPWSITFQVILELRDIFTTHLAHDTTVTIFALRKHKSYMRQIK